MPVGAVCPYLGRDGDPDTFYIQPHPSHLCHALDPAVRVEVREQERLCYAAHTACPRYMPLDASGRRAVPTAAARAEAVASPASSASMVGRSTLQMSTVPGASAGAAPIADAPMGGRLEQMQRLARVADLARRLSFEEWAIYLATGGLLVAVAWFLFLRDASAGQRTVSAPAPAGGSRAIVVATVPAIAPARTAVPSDTPRATRSPATVAVATMAVPTSVDGGMMAAISPSQRGVGSYNGRERVAQFGRRELNVGTVDGQEYVGGMLFPLSRLPRGSRISYVALELAGLSAANLAGDGVWTVQMLDPVAADDWGNLTFESLVLAPATQMETGWQLRAADLAPRKVNVLEFSADARDNFIGRLAQGKVAFRIRGPRGARDNLFTWDTGYGEGFGTRPVLRVGFVPPPATAGPRPGEPTPLPLVVWIGEPTPAPSATPLPGDVPALLSGMILFVSDRFGQPRLMVHDLTGNRIGQVTQSWPYDVAKARQLSASGVSVSVAGRPCGSGATPVVGADDKVIVAGDPARQCSQLVVSTRDAPEPREITAPGFIHYDPAVSPDGQWIAYASQITGGDEIFKIRTDGGENTRLTENTWEWDKHPSWSPDGARIVYWSNRDGRKQLYVADADGSNARNISANAYNDWDPVWVR